MTNFFYKIYLLIHSRKVLSFLGFIVFVIGLGFLASKIEFEEDISKLIPTNNQNTDAQKVLKTVNFADKIIVNIKKEPSGTLSDVTHYAEQLIDSLNKNSKNYFKTIQGKIEDESVLNTLDFVYEHLPLFLDASDYTIIKNKLEKDSIDAITQANYKTLVSPSGFVAKETILKDPLGLSFMALKKLQQLNFGDAFTLENGFLVSKDKKHVLLFISPTHDSSETAENALFVEQLYAFQEGLNASFSGKVHAEYFGGVLIAVANAQQIKRDIQITVGIAMSILLLILMVFYKKISIPLILFTPTAFGALLGIALLFLIRTKISAISLGLGSVLLGITLDYALHILTHIRSNNNIKALYQDITKPILMSSLTTALAFLCLVFLKSQALQDLGIFAAISVLGASVFSLIFIPQVYKDAAKTIKKETLLDKVANYAFHKNKWVLGLLILVFGASLFTYNKASFNSDISQLNFEPPELMEAQKRLDVLTNSSSKSVYVVAYADSENEALATNDSIFSTLSKFQDANKIIDFSSIGSLITSEASQQNHLDLWNNFWNPELVAYTKNQLISSSELIGFKPSSFQQFYTLLESDFKPLKVTDFQALPTVSIEDYITTKEGFTTVSSLVKLEDAYVDTIVNAFKDQPQTLVINRKQMNEAFLGALKTDFNNLVLYSLAVVLLLLLLFYRSVSLTLVTSIPIGLTWLLTIGIMGFTGVEFNIFNIIISTFIFGLGIDYSIFITNGLLHELKTGENVLPTHKTSIILSVITTILGVGVLVFAKHPALYSISLVSLIGILSAIIISFALQPILFKFFIGSKSNRPAPLLMFFHSCISFTYYGLGGLFLSLFGIVIMKILPISKKKKMGWFHRVMSKFMKSVLDSYPFFKTRVLNPSKETFEKQAVIIANHTSFLDILAIGMLHPKIIFLVNDWVYNSPFFGKGVQLAGFYPVSSGIENGVLHLQKKVDQGYSLMAFPEGTRSYTNKMKRFHKGAFYLAEQFNLDIVPVLIHGNSEVLPKGNFVIKKGAITITILDRILASDKQYGDTARERTKKISAYFKDKFKTCRKELEDAAYFHSVVLEDYRYKGDAIYGLVKQDLKRYQQVYKTVMDTVGEKETVLHLSKVCGQLDFLLALDSSSREIYSFIENPDLSKMVKNSYISNNHYKFFVLNDSNDAIKTNASVLIINKVSISDDFLRHLLELNFVKVILLFESHETYINSFIKASYSITHQADNITILTK